MRFLLLKMNSLSPYQNIAVEEYIFNHFDPSNEIILLLWQNQNSVILGRYQNIFLECDSKFIEQNEIKLARRISGGGTVFHDENNLNFSFFISKNSFDKRKNLSLIVDVLRKVGVEIEINSREDLTYQGKKVSGSAYRMIKDRVLHHGTLLLKSNLDLLRKCLATPKSLHEYIKTHAVSSVRSSVTNIDNIDKKLFTSTLLSISPDTYFNVENTNWEFYEEKSDGKSKLEIGPYEIENSYLEKCLQKYSSHEWIFGENPSFSLFLPKEWLQSDFYEQLKEIQVEELNSLQNSLRIKKLIEDFKDRLEKDELLTKIESYEKDCIKLIYENGKITF